MFSVLTPTGDRSESLQRCIHWMRTQTVKPAQWVIVDDGDVPSQIDLVDIPVTYLRRERQADDPVHTLGTNVRYAIPYLENDRVIIFEDDDFYSPEYLEKMDSFFEFGDLVGQIPAHYYHVGLRKYKVFNNLAHASFCQTGFILSQVLPILLQATRCENPRTVHQLDIRLWRAFKGTKYLDRGKPLCLGLKGLTGRLGLSHWQKDSAWSGSSVQDDSSLAFLTSHMGSAVRYLFPCDIDS